MIMKRNTLLACLFALALAACSAGTYFTWGNARQLKAGMSKTQVTALLGAPYLVRTVSDTEGVTEIWVWSYATSFGDSRVVSVEFVSDTVASAPVIPETFTD